MRRLLLLATLALAAGCTRDPDPFALDDSAVTVHAVLEAGADSAVVFIARPAPGGFYQGRQYRPVTGAEVALVAGSDTTWFVEDPAVACVPGDGGADPGDGCYRADLAAPIAPGAAYGLDIRLPDGTRVTGATVVPRPGRLIAPTSGQRVVVRCQAEDSCWPRPPDYDAVAILDLEWSVGEGVAGVQVAVSALEVHYRGATYPGSDCILGFGPEGGFRGVLTSERVRWTIPAIQCQGEETAASRFDSIHARVRVVGLDDAYAEYAEALWNSGTIRAESASRGLSGAFGVFGSAAVATTEVMLIRDPAPPPPDPVAAAR